MRLSSFNLIFIRHSKRATDAGAYVAKRMLPRMNIVISTIFVFFRVKPVFTRVQ